MKRKNLIILVSTLLVVILSITFAYYTSSIINSGERTITLGSSTLKIVFNNGSSSIAGNDIEPGWSSTSTFSITNNSNTTYKYNIVIQDLINTFVTSGYLQYKITSTNNGLNMDSYKDVPKSSNTIDKVLAYSIEIPKDVTQEYTISFVYTNDENASQNVDQGKSLSGNLYITEGTEQPTTLYDYILADNPTVSTRTSFNTTFTSNTTGTIFQATEKNVHNTTDTTVYYYAGNTTNNWVYFAGFYWRIIRTNADGSVRLLYHGTSPDSTSTSIGTSAFNYTYADPMYAGYMYGTSGTLDSNRENTNDSTIKVKIDDWYENNLLSYANNLSTTAVYCNDRNLATDSTYNFEQIFYYGAKERITSYSPSYDCMTTTDAFSVENSLAKLTYPIALMTADEILYAGGKYWSSLTEPYAWYYLNSKNESSIGTDSWWLLSPWDWAYNSSSTSYPVIIRINGSTQPGSMVIFTVSGVGGKIRPSISIKSTILVSEGSGDPNDPYILNEE